MPLIGILLAKLWKPMLLAGLIAAALAYRALLIHQRDAAVAQVAALTAEAAALRTTNQALGAGIERQNAAVAQLRNEADAAVNAMAANEAAASRSGAAAESEAAQQAHSLIGAAIDVNAGCAGAIRWGNAQAQELSRW
jgi:hypothetical protein